MQSKVLVYDPTANDPLSKVRGVGRYLQILKENFPDWTFSNNLTMEQSNNRTIFINPFFNFLKPPLTMRRIAKKQIAVIHDLIPLKYPSHFPLGVKAKINFPLNQFALNNYDNIVTDSEASKKDIVEILNLKPDKVRVVYPCLPKIFTNSEYKIHNSEFNSEFIINNSTFCLYVGDATWNKNIVNFAKAIKEINVTCVFVGKVFEVLNKTTNYPLRSEASQLLTTRSTNPWNRELNEFMKEVDNDKRFIFPGYVEDNQLIGLYQKAKCHILISRDEGFGFPYLEAASQSCASLLSDIPVLREISSDDMLFVDPEDVHSIANQIGELYFGSSLSLSLGNKAHDQFKKYNSEKFQRDFKSILT